jgi:hypothetical protein
MPLDRGGRRERPLLLLLSLLLLVFFFIGAFVRYGGAGHDDEFIFLWAGRSLATHPWFANVNGDLEDMVSSPLTGLVAAAADRLAPQGSLVIFKLFGLMAAAAVLPLVAMTVARLCGAGTGLRLRTAYALLAALGVALAPTFGYWAAGGMETPFQALALLLLALALAAQRTMPGAFHAASLAVAATTVVLLRMEGPWVLLLALLVLAGGRHRMRLQAGDMIALGLPAAVFALVAIWRYQHTGAAWPNPVYAKGGDIAELIPLGLAYAYGFALSTPLAALLQLMTWSIFLLLWFGGSGRLTLLPAERSLLLALSGLAVGQDLFTIFAGGNWMSYYRFLAPTLPLKIILLIWAVARCCPRGRSAFLATVALSLLVVGQLFQSGRNPNYPDFVAEPAWLWPLPATVDLAQLQRMILLASPAHARDERELRPFVATSLPALLPAGRPLCIATYQVGYFPWMVRERLGPGQVRIADTLGLNDRIAARRPGPRNPFGVLDGFAIDRLLQAGEPTLFRLCGGQPDLVYVLQAPPVMRANMAALGYRLVWDRPGAVIFGLGSGHG